MDHTLELFKTLTEADGVPGFEREVRKHMERYLAPVSEELLRDNLGGIVGKKTGVNGGPRILIAGHLDEVGFMVTHVTEKGFVHFQPVGGWWPNVMLAQRVRIKGRYGDVVGIIGSKPPHVLSAEDRNKIMPIKDMFIDMGAKDREDAEKLGVRPGDMITPVSDFFTMRNGELLAGKAMDNRAGCAVAVQVLQHLQDMAHPNVVYSGATVQEEVGLRGAETLANLVRPDIAIAVDVGLAYDTPGFDSHPASANVGEGPLMLIYDASMVPHVGLRNLIMDTAKELDIHLQVDAIAGGGTDAGSFHLSGAGCPSIALGFATRYIHSHTAVLARRDFEQLVTLITAVVKKLDAITVQSLKND